MEHEFPKSGIYTVSLTGVVQETGVQDALCSATVSEDIQVFSSKFPNIITPNEDGINDKFEFPGLEADGSTSYGYDVKIYDRLGNPVYASPSYRNDWSARGLPSDVYFYVLTLPDGGETCKGWVHVLK